MTPDLSPLPDLVSTDRLARELGAPDLRVVDCTYLNPVLSRDARAEYGAAHIPDARFLDLGVVADRTSALPIMRPCAARFEAALGAIGIGTGDRIVLYDDSPWRTAARAWFTFRSFGLAASILDGGLGKWRAEGRPLEGGERPVDPASIEVEDRAIGVVAMADVRRAMDDAGQIVDARSAARFTGAEPDPRPGVAPGHIPGSVNLPYARLFAPDGTYRPTSELAGTFADAGIDLDRPVVATCGSGVTASALAFAAHLLGRTVPVYDGSWTEWGADPATPKATV